jgi:hypothetical protein
MHEPTLHDTGEEIIEVEGKIISKKTIRQFKTPSKKFLGIEVSAIEMLLKVVGVVTTFVAVFQFIESVKEHQQQQLFQEKTLAEQERNEKVALSKKINNLKSNSKIAWIFYMCSGRAK